MYLTQDIIKIKEERTHQVGSIANVFEDMMKQLAFLTMVINCGPEAERQIERIEIFVAAVKRFLDIVEITGEEVQGAFRPSSSLD